MRSWTSRFDGCSGGKISMPWYMVCSCPNDISVPPYCTVCGAVLLLSAGAGVLSCCSSATFARSYSFSSLRTLSELVVDVPTLGGPLSHRDAPTGDPFPFPLPLRPRRSRMAKLLFPLPLPLVVGPDPCRGALHWVQALEVIQRPVRPQALQVHVGLPCAAFGTIEPWCVCSR